MKAITINQYGAPDVLQLKEVEKPIPGDKEVLVKIHAASVNPLDWHFMRGTPRLARLTMGWSKPVCDILGADLAGKVEAVGKEVTGFQPGDEVYGDTSMPGLGAFAEYVCADQSTLALKPNNLTFEEAAAVPVAAITALQALRHGKIQKGQQVLVNGASGGVGIFTVQLAKSFGAEVTGVCSTGNVELVKSLGADHVIDYTHEDFSDTKTGYDLIIDNVGNRSISTYRQALKPQGTCVIVGYTSAGLLVEHMVYGPIRSLTGGRKVGVMGTANPNREDLDTLKELLETGKIKPVIDRRYPLEETAEAIRYLETGHARAKVVITIAN